MRTRQRAVSTIATTFLGFAATSSFLLLTVPPGSSNLSRSFLTTSSSSISSTSVFTQASNSMTTSSEEYSSGAGTGNESKECEYDSEYPGTSVQRMLNVRRRVAQLNATAGVLDGQWEDVRRKLLWAGGLRDLPNVQPGRGYTGHSFNDYNHVDLTTMADNVHDNTNDGKVRGIAHGNRLGRGIKIASLPELGPGGSWTTCQIGCHIEPPQDVAHVQFVSRIAFKLVWSPVDDYRTFVLVDDEGNLLAKGTPQDDGWMPPKRERELNFATVKGSKYAVAAAGL